MGVKNTVLGLAFTLYFSSHVTHYNEVGTGMELFNARRNHHFYMISLLPDRFPDIVRKQGGTTHETLATPLEDSVMCLIATALFEPP